MEKLLPCQLKSPTFTNPVHVKGSAGRNKICCRYWTYFCVVVTVLFHLMFFCTGWSNESSSLSLRFLGSYHYASLPDSSRPYDVTLLLKENTDINLISCILTSQWWFNIDTNWPLSVLTAFVQVILHFYDGTMPFMHSSQAVIRRSAVVKV